MQDSVDVQEAVRRSIQTEKNAMDFYALCAKHMKDPEAIKTFELLAREEREHADWFYKVYKGSELGSFGDFMKAEPSKESDWLGEKERQLLPSLDERKAMELAMEKEQQLEKHLRSMAEKIADPEVRAVYEANAKSTHNHYLLIESEYARLMGMVHETDIDTYVRE